VAINTCHMYSELATSLGHAFDTLCEPVIARLVSMASLTKKIVASSSQQTLDTIVIHTNPQPKTFMNTMWLAMQDKNISMRQYGAGHIKVFLEAHGQKIKYATDALEPLEKSIKRGLADSNPAVREASRAAFWVFEGIWKERGAIIMVSLDNTARKQLEKACPNGAKVIMAPITPAAKKSSVAAAIAASRAKAKALATAPPNLKHQPASSSLVEPPSPSPPQVLRSSTSPKEGVFTIRRPSNFRPMSPSSPPPRKASGFSPSSSYSGFPPTSVHVRTQSAGLPPSPGAQHMRFASSHLRAASPSLRLAADTALPPSPRGNADNGFAGAYSPSRKERPRPASPSRIPSPTRVVSRGKEVRSSLFALTQQRNLNGIDESLLLAQNIPLPEDSESGDESQMMSFSAPFEKYHISLPKTIESSLSANSPPANAPEPIVEDALRARAAQAESAAERLLELNEDDDEMNVSPLPPSLLQANGNDATPRASNVFKSRTNDEQEINYLETGSNVQK
jgi:CLIP-associating protein 1/2